MELVLQMAVCRFSMHGFAIVLLNEISFWILLPFKANNLDTKYSFNLMNLKYQLK